MNQFITSDELLRAQPVRVLDPDIALAFQERGLSDIHWRSGSWVSGGRYKRRGAGRRALSALKGLPPPRTRHRPTSYGTLPGMGTGTTVWLTSEIVFSCREQPSSILMTGTFP